MRGREGEEGGEGGEEGLIRMTRLIQYALFAGAFAAIPLTGTLASDANIACGASQGESQTPSSASPSASDRSHWPTLVVEAERLRDQTDCPIRFVQNIPPRRDHLPQPTESIDQQLEQALTDAQAENHSKANLTALVVQPGAFALDLALIPLKTLRGVIQATKKNAARTESPCCSAADVCSPGR